MSQLGKIPIAVNWSFYQWHPKRTLGLKNNQRDSFDSIHEERLVNECFNNGIRESP